MKWYIASALIIALSSAVIVNAALSNEPSLTKQAPALLEQAPEPIAWTPAELMAVQDVPAPPTTYTLTAYCPCEKCCGKSDGITASGSTATEGRTIAVDPDEIPLGSTVRVDGHEYIAEDVGGAVKGARLDIFFRDHQDALRFGVRTTTDVEVDR